MKRTALKPGKRRRLTEEERARAWEFKLAVQGRPCVVCGWSRPPMAALHGIEAQYLRTHHPDHVYDVRNAVPICPDWVQGTRTSCHGDHTSAKKRIPRASLPASVEEFAAELGLTHLLDRFYPGSEAA